MFDLAFTVEAQGGTDSADAADRVAARRLTTADSIEVSGGDFSGEVEFEDPVLQRSIRHAYDVIELPVLG